MLSNTIENISLLLGLDSVILPNLITFIIVVILLLLTLKSQLSWTSIVVIYFISMGILELLGIESVFNLITLVRGVISEVIDLIFMGVYYGR